MYYYNEFDIINYTFCYFFQTFLSIQSGLPDVVVGSDGVQQCGGRERPGQKRVRGTHVRGVRTGPHFSGHEQQGLVLQGSPRGLHRRR